jgi:hypothetical protein
MDITAQDKPIRDTSQHKGFYAGLFKCFFKSETSTNKGPISEVAKNTPKPPNEEARGDKTPPKARKLPRKRVEQASDDDLQEWVDVEEELGSDSEWVSIIPKHC